MPGGLARVTLNLQKELLERFPEKYDIKIVTATLSNPDFLESHENILNLGLKPLHSLSKLKKINWYIQYYRSLRMFFSDHQPDVCIGIATMTNLTLCLSKPRKAKLYATEHMAYENQLCLIRALRSRIYQQADKVITLTERDLQNYSHPCVASIPNFSTFDTNKEMSSLDTKTILSIGTYSPRKGYDRLLKEIKPFFDLHPDWQLILIGDGPLRSKMEQIVIDKSLTKNVHIRGVTENVASIYLNSSIYIMTSKFEGFPMVLLEAKSFGLPIVSFDCPTGPSEIIEDNDGFLVKNGDFESFIEKLHLLAQDRNLRQKMGCQALINIKKFSADSILKKWERLLDE